MSLYPVLCGAVFGLVLMKFGNPVILDQKTEPPEGIFELIFLSWPVWWGLGYGLLALMVVTGGRFVQLKTAAPRWILWMPLAWLGWQLVSATQTVEPELTYPTIPHFMACVVCFYLGIFVLAKLPRSERVWLGLSVGFLFVLLKGFSQHYGELEETRKYIYEHTDWRKLSPDFLARLSSNRIFSSFVLANSFAGAILLLLPGSLVYLGQISQRWPKVLRGVSVGIVAYMGAGCLYWTGSKAGWLIGLVMISVVFLRQPVSKTIKLALIGGILVCGLVGFVIKNRAYLEKGATSVGARFDYWRAALQTTIDHPVVGTGPGTFQVPYKRLKPAEAEFAQLAHNDYLEQASDSGLPGFLTYLTFIAGSIGLLYRKLNGRCPLFFAAWLGVLGMALQGAVEFWLYIPALAWVVFLLLGWLWGLSALNGTEAGQEMKSTKAA